MNRSFRLKKKRQVHLKKSTIVAYAECHHCQIPNDQSVLLHYYNQRMVKKSQIIAKNKLKF